MNEKKLKKAIFAAGCFWQVEEAFRHLKGVENTTAGYTGGKFPRPTYEKVCGGETGHAEAVEVTYDPDTISYPELLGVFFASHDPTELNGQGPDVGEQYRSAIFYGDGQEKKYAESFRAALEKSGKYKKPIMTEIVPAKEFWRAEEYHQRYLEKTGQA